MIRALLFLLLSPALCLAQDLVVDPDDLRVFNVTKRPDSFLLLPVGTVPVDTPCDPNQTVNGTYAVPFDAVEWSAGTSIRPVVVTANCVVVAGSNSVTLNWTNATENTDGSPLALSDIEEIAIYDEPSGIKIVAVPPDPTTTTLVNVAAGTRCYYATTRAYGEESDPSNVTCKEVP